MNDSVKDLGYWAATFYFAVVTVFLIFVIVVNPAARTDVMWFGLASSFTLTLVLWEIATNLSHFRDVVRSLSASNILLVNQFRGQTALRQLTLRDHSRITADSQKLLNIMDEIKKEHDSINVRLNGFSTDSKGEEV